MNYIPLHVYSGYSFQKSGLQIEQYCLALSKLGITSAAITDFETLTSSPVFAHEAKKHGIKPIIGEDFIIDNLLVSVIAKNELGYKTLLNYSFLNQIHKLNFKVLQENSDDVVIILSTENMPLKKAMLENSQDFAVKLAKIVKGIKDFYIGIDMIDVSFAKLMREFALNHSYNVVAFPHIKYLKKDDALILKMVEAIETKDIVQAKKLNGNQYLKTIDEINLEYTLDEINNTNVIANSINFELIKQRGRLIKFPCPNNYTSDEYLRILAFDGLKKNHHEGQIYIDRLNYELDTIQKMGFSDYFLIVQDYVDFARKNDIAVGPGRGSASGSLVAHCLGITVPDPIQYGLLFERFLNPARQTMPDIDVDFSDIDRERIVDYIAEKYGIDHVAKIIAVQKIGAKQSLHDVGRIFGYEERDINLFTNIIKDDKFDKLSLREIYKNSKDFRDLVNNDKYYLEIVSLASKIEGLPRQDSTHAVGIVLNAEPLNETIPLTIENGSLIEQFEKDYIEEQGFLKMDILAIRNLSIIDDCLLRLKEKGINLNRDEIPYDDKKAIDVIASGRTIGIFQLNTPKFRTVLKTFKPSSFEDVVALLALNRPGPKENIPVYSRRKDGVEKFSYLHPALKEILEPTYGILVYQEQIMQVASKMAGFTLAEADLLRRAISKKDSSKLISMKKRFIEGSIKNGYKQADAEDVFKAIYKFGDFGFNRSHSVVYAIFSCRMAYLKAYYPEEFYAAILGNASAEEFNNTIAEMKSLNIKVCTPDINVSDLTFLLKDKKIIFPLSAIKGIGLKAAENIMEERKNKPFADIYDFVLRISKYKFSPQQVMNLIDSGAFDNIEKSRASLRANLAGAFTFADVFVSDGESDSFLDPSMFAKPTFVTAEDDILENLNREFNVLGLMVSGSPLDVAKDKIQKLNSVPLSELSSHKGTIKTVVVLKTFKRIHTKTGKIMAFLTVYDDSTQIEVTMFEEALEISSSLKKNKVVILEGYFNKRRQDFNVDKMTLLEELNNE